MYTILTDPHTHTIASGHAFSTLEENVRAAAARGLQAIAMTDHFGPLFSPIGIGGRPAFTAMHNMSAFPKEFLGVRVLAGAEVDILDTDGRLFGWDVDMRGQSALDWLLQSRDIAIASVHFFEDVSGISMAEGTRMYCRALETPGVHVLGHIGRAGVAFDVREVLVVAKRHGKLIEINNHSFDFEAAKAPCKKIAEMCAELGVQVAVSSDAHCSMDVGKFGSALSMLEEIGFPEELIANRTLQTLKPRWKPAGGDKPIRNRRMNRCHFPKISSGAQQLRPTRWRAHGTRGARVCPPAM